MRAKPFNRLDAVQSMRIGDLREWHFVEAKCSACEHVARLNPERLMHLAALRQRSKADAAFRVRLVGHQRIIDVAARLRCRLCGNRAMNALTVRPIERD